MKRIVIACGGTGGHLTPGIALAQSLEEQGDDSWLFISRKTVDSRLSKKYSNLKFVPMPGAALIRTPWGIFAFCRNSGSPSLNLSPFVKRMRLKQL